MAQQSEASWALNWEPDLRRPARLRKSRRATIRSSAELEYLGARGYFGQAVTSTTVATRMASMAEDPANRRVNGGGKTRFVVYLIPDPQLASSITGVSMTSAEVRAGSSFSTTFAGSNLDEN